MKLLHLITDTDRRGAQVFGNELAVALRDRGHDVTVRALAPGDRDRGLDVVSLGPSRLSITTMRALRRLVADHDAVVAFGSTTLPAAVITAYGLGTPVVYRSIGDIRDWATGFMRSRRTAWLLQRCARVVAQWPAAAATLTNDYGVDDALIVRIPRGVDTAQFPFADATARKAARAHLGLPQDDPIIAVIGSLSHEKRVDRAIDAVACAEGQLLVIAGDGPERAALHKRVPKTAQERIRFLGVVDDPHTVYAACDALVLPSASEGIPGVLIEAALTGRPAVATDVGGVSTVVVDGVTGRVVDAHATPAAIAEALTFVLDRAEEMGAAAHRHAATHFDMELVAEQYELLLGRVMPKLRILHIVSRSQPRGAEIAALELATELDELGHENRVLALARATSGQVVPEVPLLSGGDLGPLDRARSALALRREVQAWRPAIVIGHGGTAAMVAVLACTATRTRVVWQRILEFSPYALRRTRRGLLWRAVANRIDAVVAITDHLADEMETLGFRGQVWRIPNTRRWVRFAGIDRRASRRALQTELGTGSATAIVGLVGHLVDQKRPERAVEAFDHLRAEGLDVHLVVVGDGPRRATVERAVRSAGLEGHVTLLGHRSDIPSLLAGLDLLVVTSDSEAMTGTVIEAQMAGTPVVSFPLDGALDAIDHGHSGLVLRLPDTRELADEIASLLRDPERLRSMSKRAVEHGATFATEVVVRQYDERLRELVGGRGAQ